MSWEEAAMNIYEKLSILAESAKYDASCSTSGTERKNTGRMGNASCAGICHSWSADGRCISLLKVLLTNKCIYDCEYCINRRSADTARASFEPEELASLVMEFYRRNYIEGLFLSSAVEGSPDRTSERMLRCLELLRGTWDFAGYIHAKIIPGTSPELVHAIGLAADRLSVNIELPTSKSLAILAPQKKAEGIFTPMRQITEEIADRRQLRSGGDALWDGGKRLQYLDGGFSAIAGDEKNSWRSADFLSEDASAYSAERQSGGFPMRRNGGKNYKEVFAPAGQSTQMIVGASKETDAQIVRTMQTLYQTFRMKRIYYSAYIPVRESPLLPSLLTPPPLKREHRLYQADWLLRFYGFSAEEIADEQNPFLDKDVDPKMSWALRHMDLFPIEINKASIEELLRVPGIGALSARRIVRQKRRAAVHFDDLKNMGVVVKRARYFITCCGRFYGESSMEPELIRGLVSNAEPKRKKKSRYSLLAIDDKQEKPMDSADFNRSIEEESSSAAMIPGSPEECEQGEQLSMFSLSETGGKEETV